MRRLLVCCTAILLLAATPPVADADLDTKVRAFLDSHRGTWHDMNIPASDGRLLHDLIIAKGFTRALEIGTSTGHSGIWIAWALSKTGGKLITIDIDASRRRQAVKNFEEAGLAGYIEARLGDAHEIVPALEGPFDFVFSDADKEWYKNYFVALSSKMSAGGCFAAHNVSMPSRDIREFVDYLQGLPNYETTIDNSSHAGISISCRKAADDSPDRR